MRRALITGITGQDGSYLAELLLGKGYEVHAILRHSSSFNMGRINHLLDDSVPPKHRPTLHFGDLTDNTVMQNVIKNVRPDEVYNLAAQSHIKISLDSPEYTGDANALGATRILEAIRSNGLTKTTRFYQASTSELFGEAPCPQNELTPFHPRNPYGVSKLFAHWMAINYRKSYGMFTSCGILFNHESPRRGELFVSGKISRAAARIKLGLQDKLMLGNLDAKRDWGHARDYVEAIWLMLQQETPDDFVIASGVEHSVRDFCHSAFTALGIELAFSGNGADEIGIDVSSGKTIIAVDPEFFRPAEATSFRGDTSKAKAILGWEPRTSFEEMVQEMATHDLNEARKEELLKAHGLNAR